MISLKKLLFVFLILTGVVSVWGLKSFAQNNSDGLNVKPPLIVLELKDLKTENGEIKGTFNYINKTDRNFNDLTLRVILQEKFKQEEIVEGGNKTSVLTAGKIIAAREEKLSLIKPQESGSIAVSLVFPKNISGDLYRFRVILTDNLGNVIAQTQAEGGIKIKGENKFSEVGVSDCSVVKGEQKFNFGEETGAASFKPGENIEVQCLVSNNSKEANKMALEISWNEFGGAVFQTDGAGQSVVSPLAELKPKESRVIKATIPPISKPAIYQGALRFLDEQKNALTSLYTFRWAIEGESAKIRKIELDKDFYDKKEIIQLSISYFLSADLAGPSIKIEIKDKNQQLCGVISEKLKPAENEAVYKIPSQLKCQDPEVKAEILSGEKILDSAAKKYISAPTESSQKHLSQKTLLILAIAAIFLLILFLFSKYGKGKKLSDYYNYVFFAFFFLIAFNLLFGSKVFSAVQSFPGPLQINWWRATPFEISGSFPNNIRYSYQNNKLNKVYVPANTTYEARLNDIIFPKTKMKFVIDYSQGWPGADSSGIFTDECDPVCQGGGNYPLDIVFVRGGPGDADYDNQVNKCLITGCVVNKLFELTGSDEGFGRFTARRMIRAGFAGNGNGWYPKQNNDGVTSFADGAEMLSGGLPPNYPLPTSSQNPPDPSNIGKGIVETVDCNQTTDPDGNIIICTNTDNYIYSIPTSDADAGADRTGYYLQNIDLNGKQSKYYVHHVYAFSKSDLIRTDNGTYSRDINGDGISDYTISSPYTPYLYYRWECVDRPDTAACGDPPGSTNTFEMDGVGSGALKKGDPSGSDAYGSNIQNKTTITFKGGLNRNWSTARTYLLRLVARDPFIFGLKPPVSVTDLYDDEGAARSSASKPKTDALPGDSNDEYVFLTLNPLPACTLTILPTSYTLLPGQTGSFTASGGNGSITWEITSNNPANAVSISPLTGNSTTATANSFGAATIKATDTISGVDSADYNCTKTATVNAAPALTVSKSGAGSGAITGNVNGLDDGNPINCGSDCSDRYSYNTSVILTASPNFGSVFANWSVCDGVISGNRCAVTMTSNKSATAVFNISPMSGSIGASPNPCTIISPATLCSSTISWTVSNAVNWQVWVDNINDISPATTFSGVGSSSSDNGPAPWINAPPNEYVFYLYGCSSVVASCDASNGTLLNQVTVTAVIFDYELTNSGDITVPQSFSSSNTITAIRTSGASSPLVSFSVSGLPAGASASAPSCSPSPTCSRSLTVSTLISTVVGTYPITVTGSPLGKTTTFNLIVTPAFPFTVNKAGTGSGTISGISNPSQSNINCPAACITQTRNYQDGTTINLTASPSVGSSFDSWSVCDGVISGNECAVTMTSSKAATAIFTATDYTLSVEKTGNGNGTITSSPSGINCPTDCGEIYVLNTSVTLIATPSSPKDVFTGWSGCDSTGDFVVGGEIDCRITINDADMTENVSADFTPLYTLDVSINPPAGGSVTGGIDTGGIGWWDNGWTKRKKLTISAPILFNVPAGYSVKFSASGLDAADIYNDSKPNGDDLRVVYWNGSGWEELDRDLINFTSTATEVWWKLKSGITKTQSSSDYYLYYDNSGAGAPLSNKENVYLFYDGFDGASLDSVKWPGSTANIDRTVFLSGGGELTLTDKDNNSSVGMRIISQDIVQSAGAGVYVESKLRKTAININGGVDMGITNDINGTAWMRLALNDAVSNLHKAESSTGSSRSYSNFNFNTDYKYGINHGSGWGLYINDNVQSNPTGALPVFLSNKIALSVRNLGGGAIQTGVYDWVKARSQYWWETQIIVEAKEEQNGGTSIDCGADCAENYLENTVVELTANPAAGYTFINSWSGDCSGNGLCSLTMDEDKSVTAKFTPSSLDLDVVVMGNGTITNSPPPLVINCPGDCNETYNVGDTIILTAVADSGSEFTVWSVSGGSSSCDSNPFPNQCVITINGNTTVTAAFNLSALPPSNWWDLFNNIWREKQ